MADIIFDNVSKDYQMGEVTIHAAKQVSFQVKSGELCIILGPSGAGKTTVLNLLGGMETATSGKILFAGQDITVMNDLELTDYRRYKIGFVFQFYNLIPNLTAAENVELAKQVCKSPLEADEALRIVGLKDRIHNFPAQLSGGEQQRVAIARAICKNPDLLLCDEPTGALDFQTSRSILKLLQQVNEKYGTTILMITHNAAIAAMANRVFKLRSGEIAEDVVNQTTVPAERIEW